MLMNLHDSPDSLWLAEARLPRSVVNGRAREPAAKRMAWLREEEQKGGVLRR
jgi:hypothetical protein